MYDYILFDLDGTLSDPGLGITNSVMHALKHWNIEVAERSTLYKFIGPPLKDSFMNYYDFSEAQAVEAIAVYREYFSVRGLFENELYEGIPRLLQTLRESGKKLFVATSKPEFFSVEILKHFGIDGCFDFVGGAAMDETRTKKDEVIRYVFEKAGITELSKTVMVGDREHDIFGAKKCGIASIGVLYGYGNREELTAAGADHIAEKVEDILKFV